MSTRRRSRRHIRTRPPHRQPMWLMVGAVIIALGTIALVAAAILTR
ncbi:hypothetical protein ACFXP7_13790 [Microbacterium sp. P06]